MKESPFSDILKIGGLDKVLDLLSGASGAAGRSSDAGEPGGRGADGSGKRDAGKQPKSDLELAKEELARPGVTFAVALGGVVASSEERGVRPLLAFFDDTRSAAKDDARSAAKEDSCPGTATEHYSGRGILSGATCADKVVGKAPALLYVLLGVKHVYARVTTRDAVRILNGAGIKFDFDNCEDAIMNDEKTDTCPMEKLVADTDDPGEALRLIFDKVSGRA